MIEVNADGIPKCLKERHQWIVWKIVMRDGKPNKVPFNAFGREGKSNDPSTWSDFKTAIVSYSTGQWSGIGYVFSADDEFCGIDLDGCRDPETGKWAEWAREIIKEFSTYTELSPSGSGAKMFVRGKFAFDGGKKIGFAFPGLGGKNPGVEVYDKLRYFAVTGKRLSGTPDEPEKRQELLDRYSKVWFAESPASGGPVCDFYTPTSIQNRAGKYISTMAPSISGQKGHDKAFAVACALILGFELSPAEAYPLFCEWNRTCQPPWSEREIRHKLDQADKQNGERGYLKNVRPERWQSVHIPYHKPPEQPPESTTLIGCGHGYLESLKGGKQKLISLGIGDVDYMLCGGVVSGEMIVIAGRPGHFKSGIALQSAYSMAADGLPGLVVSEEMMGLELGKRVVSFSTSIPEDVWPHRIENVATHVNEHFADKAEIHVVEKCTELTRAVDAIEEHVEKNKIRFVIVDYAQLLRGRGRGLYERTTDVTQTLRNLAQKHDLVLLLLAQLNREIEGREKYVPRLSDIRDSGSFEQDAHVILFVVWPHRLNPKRDPSEFFVFAGKNKNRGINGSGAVKCRFEPSRQRVSIDPETEHAASEIDYEATSDQFEERRKDLF